MPFSRGHRWFLTLAASLGMITAGLIGQSASLADDLEPAAPQVPPAAGVPPGTPPPPAAAPTAAHIAAVEKTLAKGPPSGLSQVLSEWNQKKVYRLGYTKLLQHILAKSIAEKVAKKDVRTLTNSSLDPVVDGLSKDDISKLLQERFKGMTGLTPPKKEELRAHINRQNGIARQILKLQPKTLRLAPQKQPDPDCAGLQLDNEGICGCEQRNRYRGARPERLWLLLGLRDSWRLRGGLREEQGSAHRGLGTIRA